MGEAGVDIDIDWQNVVMIYSYAPIPVPPMLSEFSNRNRGFNLVVLARGRPKFFVKCRPARDEVLERETLIRSALAGYRPDGLSVAPVRAAASTRIAIQVSPFVGGSHYGRVVARQSEAQYVQTLRAVLRGAAELAEVARRDCAFLRRTASTITLATVAADVLTEVSTLASLDTGRRAALASVVHDAGDVPSIPQHGDLWWQNLLLVDNRPWAIDFDSYGEIDVPFFDDLTVMITTMSVRNGGMIDGLRRLTSSDAEGRACRDVLAERVASAGISMSQVDGLLVYYLAKMASTVHRRSGADFSSPHLAALRYTADRLAAGEHDLLSPG